MGQPLVSLLVGEGVDGKRLWVSARSTGPWESWPCPAPAPHAGASVTWVAQFLTGALVQPCRLSPLGPLGKLPQGLPSYRTTCKEASLSHLPGVPIGPVNVAGTAWHSVLWPHP